jgi:hypothetical protein
MWLAFAAVGVFCLAWSLIRDWRVRRRLDRSWAESRRRLRERAWLHTHPDGRQEWMVDGRPEDSAWLREDRAPDGRRWR